jgi:hypothetical protein
MLLTLQLKLNIKKRPHSFNHNCNHYSLSEGERQQKSQFRAKTFVFVNKNVFFNIAERFRPNKNLNDYLSDVQKMLYLPFHCF